MGTKRIVYQRGQRQHLQTITRVSIKSTRITAQMATQGLHKRYFKFATMNINT